MQKKKLLQFAADDEMQKVEHLANAFYSSILEEGDEPAFVSDEATVFDVCGSEPEYLIRRCAEHYGRPVSLFELKLPFWRLLLLLNADRQAPETDPSATLRSDEIES